MIVYEVKNMFNGGKLRVIKKRVSDKNKRKHEQVRRSRRWWFWRIDKWNQRHGEDSNTVQTDM